MGEYATEKRPIYDPLNLYPKNSIEKKEGRIQPLEPNINVRKAVLDPLGLYPKDVKTDENLVKSTSMPYSRSIKDPLGLYPKNVVAKEKLLLSSETSKVSEEGVRPIFDPLRLYPEDSEERREGRIQPLEPLSEISNAVLDPLNLYPKNTPTDDHLEKSIAMPFVTRPAMLSGELVGDFGFDPFGFGSSEGKLLQLREAEIKHSRIAMLAAAGWPMSELWDKQLANVAHLKPLLVDGDRAPSILNGGLEKVSPFYWIAIIILARSVEVVGMLQGNSPNDKINGELIFDPLRLYPERKEGQYKMQLAEIKHGRIAMIAITLYAIAEFVTKTAVVDLTPYLFHIPQI